MKKQKKNRDIIELGCLAGNESISHVWGQTRLKRGHQGIMELIIGRSAGAV